MVNCTNIVNLGVPPMFIQQYVTVTDLCITAQKEVQINLNF